MKNEETKDNCQDCDGCNICNDDIPLTDEQIFSMHPILKEVWQQKNKDKE